MATTYITKGHNIGIGTTLVLGASSNMKMMTATPPVLCNICKFHLDEEKSKHAGSAQQNGLAQLFCKVC
jgi:hypothetical protein